ncbi:MAG: Bug family tripartite tricarboxylate transporter substrate binding protein [Burkholderiales bacterium]
MNVSMKKLGRCFALAGAVFVSGVLVSNAARAQAYPNKPMKMIMPIPAGSLTDVVGRAIATSLAPVFGHAVVAENRVGANGTIGMTECARSAPDGYTACMTDGNIMTINPYAYDSLPYDPKSFVPIAHLAELEVAFAVQAALPVTNLKEWLDYARARPGQATWGTTGAGSTPHLYLSWMTAKTGVTFNHIPYKGPAQLQLALIGGEINGTNMGPANIVNMNAAGKVRIIAVSHGKTRSKYIGDVPSLGIRASTSIFAIGWPLSSPAARHRLWRGAGIPKSISYSPTKRGWIR